MSLVNDLRQNFLVALTVASLALVTGCAHRQFNAPLAKVDRDNGYYFHPAGRSNQSDDILFAITFSGGGTRAAAFAFGVLEELHDTPMPGSGARTLLNEVDVISSVSGGSVTAAAYGLYGDRVFDVLPKAFLHRNVQGALALRTVNPLNWPALWSSTYGRSELAADYYDAKLFHGATFAHLQTNGSPFLVINGTDITTGTRFDFTQHSFDLICSDARPYPLASAVAASSAVPGALTPITLKNYAGGCGCLLPEWVGPALQQDAGRMSRRAAVLTSYQNRAERPFIHLVDGGVSDNIGLQPVIDYLQSVPLSPQRQKEFAQAKARKIVLIVVNAYASPKRKWDQSEAPPGSFTTAAAAASHTLDQRTLETVDYLKEALSDPRLRGQLPSDMKIYPVILSFTNFRDVKQQQFFLDLPTSFFLPGTDVDKLRAAGRELLRQNPEYQALLKDLGAGAPK
jgi:NTE family protein